MPRISVPVLLGAVLVSASGCTASAAPISATAPPAGAQVAAAPVPVISAGIAPATSPAPGLANTGTSWSSILASLAAYGQWALANPNPVNVANVAVPGCSAANLLAEQTTGLIGSQTVVQPSPAVFGTVIAPTPFAVATSEVVLAVSASRPAEPVVDRKGQPVSTFQALPQTSLAITLNRGSDQRWRFCSITAVADTGIATNAPVPLI